ncbi:MAG: type VI secretion system tip protein VgrG [Methyloprofundus sp.]|nr:type VI secretion system tip protein VgrG [Methyloprofundus sp.]
MAATQANREIEIITPLGKDALLLMDLNVTEELGRLFSISAEVASDDNMDFESLLGQNVSIRLDLPEGKRFFNGHVSDISQAVDEGKYARYVLTIRPWLWFLTRTADCRIFQHQTVPEIIKQVCADLGFTDISDNLTESYRQWEYCVQYRETDFNFLSRLMEQEGIYYFFTHEEGKHTLNLADAFGSHSPIPDYAEIPYYPPDSTVIRDDDKCITGWFLTKKIQPGSYALGEYDFTRPKANLEVDSTVSRSHVEAEYEVFDYPGDYVQGSDGDAYARKRIEELHSQYEQGQGQGRARGLMSGGLFTLQKFPRKDQNREYLVVSVNHHIQMDEYEASSGGGAVYSNNFTVVDSKTHYRTARMTPKPIVQGPQTAVVVGPSGEEIHTNEHGQVILQFHWDRYGKSNENSSCWVRVSQLWAGKTWGGIHIPRIGQEVIVEFMEGDPDRPIVTGRVYNGDQTPPYNLPANKTQSGIKSRSSQGGTGANFNELRFEDKKGAEQVYIHAEKNQDNIVENDETTFVGHDRTENIGNDETITIGNDRTENVGNNETITIANNRTEMVGVNESITIGVNRTEQVGANETITIGANRTEAVGANESITIGANRTEAVGANESIAIGKSRTEVVGINETIKIGNNRSEDVGNDYQLSIGSDQKITIGKTLVIDVGDKITIQTGKASITMKKDGTIQIVGKNILVKGSGKIDVKASKNITMKGKKILQN